MTNADSRFEELLARLRARECRITPQRIALLRLLTESAEHPSAAQLYAQLRVQYPTTSLATVYKTLNLLKEMGEVLELRFGADDNRYDPHIGTPHLHIICLRCHDIVDSEVVEFTDLAEAVAGSTGYRIISQRLDFYGLCPACQVQEGVVSGI